MTNPIPHRATSSNWQRCEDDAAHWPDATAFHCLLELRDRLAAAEQRIGELEKNRRESIADIPIEPLPRFDSISNALERNRQASLDSSTPTGSLVEVTKAAIYQAWRGAPSLIAGQEAEARAAIRAVAQWIHAAADAYPDTCGALHAIAQQLEQEADA